MRRDPACVFCRIVEGSIPAARVLETDAALAFLDIGPLNLGHTLLIPKAHYPTLLELPDDLAAAAAALLPKLCRAVRSATRAEGLNILVNTGPIAGQSVDHVHWHIIPRHRKDRIAWPWQPMTYEGDELEKTRTSLVQALKDDVTEADTNF